MTAREWIDAYATELGVDAPTEAEVEAILDLAAVAAHASERPAAPIACWIASRADRPIAELTAAAERIGGD